MGSAGPDFEAGGGVQSLRGVYSIIGMTIGNVCGEPAQLHLPPAITMAPVGSKRDGAHTCRRVHGVLGLYMGCVSKCGEPAQLHFTSVTAMPQIGKQGDGVHTRRGVHGVLVLTMMGVS